MVSHGGGKKKTRSKWYPTEIITNADNLVLLANTPAQAKSLLHSLEQAAGGISLYMNADKAQFMCFKQDRGISALSSKPLNL